MAQTPDSDQENKQPHTADDLPSPKRGAFPTPKSDIDKAKPYVPESVSAENDTEEE